MASTNIALESFENESYDENHIWIAVMGIRRSGKSTFISSLIRPERMQVVFGPGSFIKNEVDFFDLRYKNKTIHLIDMPGFSNDDHIDEGAVVAVINWLNRAYQRGHLLSGIVYLHPINSERITASHMANMTLFEKLCGPNSLPSVALATTMWATGRENDRRCGSEPSTSAEKLRRHEQFEQSTRSWGQIMPRESVFQYDNSTQSALEIIDHILSKQTTIVLEVQRQAVDEGLSISQTSVGRELVGLLALDVSGIRRRIAEAMEELNGNIVHLQKILEIKESWVQELKKEAQGEIEELGIKPIWKSRFNKSSIKTAGMSFLDADSGAGTDEGPFAIKTKYASDGNSESWGPSELPFVVVSHQHESSTTTQPSRLAIFMVNPQHLAKTPFNGALVKHLIVSALYDPRIGSKRLGKIFSRVLVAYSKDLEAIAVTELQKQASTIVQLVAASVAQPVRLASDPNLVTMLKGKEAMKVGITGSQVVEIPSQFLLGSLLGDDGNGSSASRQVEDFFKSGLPITKLHGKLLIYPAAHSLQSALIDYLATPRPVSVDREVTQRSAKQRYEEEQIILVEDCAITPSSTVEELTAMDSIQDTFFLPQSLPECIDMIFDLFRVPSVEEPEIPGKTRVRWKCQCGTQLYDDFSELAPDNLALLQSQLQGDGNAPCANSRNIKGQIQTWMKNGFSAPRRIISEVIRLASHLQRGSTLPLHSTAPSAARQRGLRVGRRDLHVMLCIDNGEELPSLYQASVSNVSNDQQLFQFLRKQYWEHRKLPSWFTLRCVKRLSLTQFKVDANDFAMLDSDDAACNPKCICLPPVERITGDEYCCSPAPECPLSHHPALAPKELTHYFKKIHAFKKVQTRIYKQIPKERPSSTM